jgi:hypothetical protein
MRIEALIEWARMLEKWRFTDNPELRLGLVEAVVPSTCVLVAESIEIMTKAAGQPLTLTITTNEGDSTPGVDLPWTGVLTHALVSRCSRALGMTSDQLMRLAFESEARIALPG